MHANIRMGKTTLVDVATRVECMGVSVFERVLDGVDVSVRQQGNKHLGGSRASPICTEDVWPGHRLCCLGFDLGPV